MLEHNRTAMTGLKQERINTAMLHQVIGDVLSGTSRYRIKGRGSLRRTVAMPEKK
jgi:hypothetical protein